MSEGDFLHYDESGVLIGRSTRRRTDDGGAGAWIMGIVALAYACQWTARYPIYNQPYSSIAFFYYWTLAFPVTLPFRLFALLTDAELTQWPHLDLAIAVLVAVGCFYLTLRFLLKLWSALSQGIATLAFSVLLAPGIIGVSWYALASTFAWLFQQPTR